MGQPTPHNLLRLSFDFFEEAVAYGRANTEMLKQIWLWHKTLGNREEPFQLLGVCDLCECQTTFTATPRKMPEGSLFAFNVPWWYEAICGCKMTANLQRAVFRVFLDGGSRKDRIYHVGQYSTFRKWLSETLPNVTSSQYEQAEKVDPNLTPTPAFMDGMGWPPRVRAPRLISSPFCPRAGAPLLPHSFAHRLNVPSGLPQCPPAPIRARGRGEDPAGQYSGLPGAWIIDTDHCCGVKCGAGRDVGPLIVEITRFSDLPDEPVRPNNVVSG
jgi:hypothetical protein